MARAYGRSVETEWRAGAKRLRPVRLSERGELPELQAKAARFVRSRKVLEVLLMLLLGFGLASSARHVASADASAPGCAACVVEAR